MIGELHPLLEIVAAVLELAGVAVLLVGVAAATIYFGLQIRRGCAWREAYGGYRANVGRGILLGLEFLVGADIVATVSAPLTFESVGSLAAIVLIRTFLSFALETEIEGRWPWRRHERQPHEEPERR